MRGREGGNATIDREHRELFSLANALFDRPDSRFAPALRSSGSSPQTIGRQKEFRRCECWMLI
jgi:hypothetical protein